MGDEERHRRKSSTNLYRNMTVSKALAVLKISEREFRELSDLEFRTAFMRRNSVSTGLSLQQDASSVGDRERNGEDILINMMMMMIMTYLASSAVRWTI